MSKSQKIPQQYTCNICDYFTCNIKDYNKHINTLKHINRTNNNNLEHQKPKQYYCKKCNKIYGARNSLWYHEQKCTINKDIPYNMNCDNKMNKDELILQLLKQNSELLELMKNGTNNCNNTTNVNSHNKTFNLQVFLNETCKDAMNITDFVDSIKLQLDDFERIGEIGYAQGISDIITSNLQALDVTQRPVHCTDKKRETMYVKHDNEWTKEDDNKSTIRKMIKNIENKNIQVLPQFRKKYPNYADPKSRDSDKYNKTIIEAMGGIGGSESKENKIIRNISKVTIIHEKE